LKEDFPWGKHIWNVHSNLLFVSPFVIVKAYISCPAKLAIFANVLVMSIYISELLTSSANALFLHQCNFLVMLTKF
jgi:hypothetical protein